MKWNLTILLLIGVAIFSNLQDAAADILVIGGKVSKDLSTDVFQGSSSPFTAEQDVEFHFTLPPKNRDYISSDGVLRLEASENFPYIFSSITGTQLSGTPHSYVDARASIEITDFTATVSDDRFGISYSHYNTAVESSLKLANIYTVDSILFNLNVSRELSGTGLSHWVTVEKIDDKNYVTFPFQRTVITPNDTSLIIETNSGNLFIKPHYLELRAIPEPSSLVLLGIGAAGLGGVARRLRHRSKGCPAVGERNCTEYGSS